MAAEADATYRRTLRLLVAVAAELEQPKNRLRGGHTVGEGYYYELEGIDNISTEDVKKISNKLESLVSDGIAIENVAVPWKEAFEYAEEHGLACMKASLTTRVSAEVKCHRVGKVLRLAFGPVHERSAGLKASKWCLVKPNKAPGFVVSYAKGDFDMQTALLNAHLDHMAWGRAHGVTSIGALNGLQQVGRTRKDYVLQCEFRQEARLAAIASDIADRRDAGKPVRLICIAGPTSSGKTTFSNKLCMYLQGRGFDAKPLTVDHYYKPLDQQPKYQARKQRIDVDYDHIESMDVELVSQQLNDIVNGKSVMTPVYNMKTGYRDGDGLKFDALPSNGILVIEGIHALNPLYTDPVESSKVYKIYISPLTALQVDDANAVKSTHHRLLRRMCRDYLFRGNSASVTMKMWDNVRQGEGEWIFPHQNKVDFVMNSAADYEIPVLKTFLEPLLKAVRPDDENYDKALQLLALLEQFNTWPPELTTGSALLREFIGGGCFDCH